jgi:hypothetical protein
MNRRSRVRAFTGSRVEELTGRVIQSEAKNLSHELRFFASQARL